MKKTMFLALGILGFCLGSRLPVVGQFSFRDTPPADQSHSRQGDAETQFRLGMACIEGEGVPQDYQRAAECLRNAARQGHAAAQFELGVMYENGEGLSVDMREAFALYALASRQGHGKARQFLQDLTESMPPAAQRAGYARAEELSKSLRDAPGKAEPKSGAVKERPATAPPTPEARAARPSSNLRLTRQSVRDPAVNNMEAMVFLLPEGWRHEGRVNWLHEWSVLRFLHMRLTDPVHNITIESLPEQNFIYFQPPEGFDAPLNGNYQGKQFLPPITDPDQFVRQFWMPRMLPHLRGARLVRDEPIPAATREYQRLLAGGTAQVSTHRLRYEYGHGGQIWEEDVAFALMFFPGQVTSWQVRCGVSTRAPRGELDRHAGVISAVMASRMTTPEWEGIYQVILRLFYEGQRQRIADTAALGRTLAQHREEAYARQQQVTEERQASQDRNSALFREALGHVESFRDNVSHKIVEMPGGWKDYWVNEKGEYLLSDQTGFNPNVGDTHSWKRMESVCR